MRTRAAPRAPRPPELSPATGPEFCRPPARARAGLSALGDPGTGPPGVRAARCDPTNQRLEEPPVDVFSWAQLAPRRHRPAPGRCRDRAAWCDLANLRQETGRVRGFFGRTFRPG